MARSGEQAFPATGVGGLRQPRQPEHPKLTASGLTVGDADAVAVQNTTTYVATLVVIAW